MKNLVWYPQPSNINNPNNLRETLRILLKEVDQPVVIQPTNFIATTKWAIAVEFPNSSNVKLIYYPSPQVVSYWINRGWIYPELSDKEYRIQYALGAAKYYRRWIINQNIWRRQSGTIL